MSEAAVEKVESDEEAVLERQLQETMQKLELIRNKKKAVANSGKAEQLAVHEAFGETKVLDIDASKLQSKDANQATVNWEPINNRPVRLKKKNGNKKNVAESEPIIPTDWIDTAFGSFSSEYELSDRLALLNGMLREMKKPELNFNTPPMNDIDEGTEISFKGKVYVRSNVEPISGGRELQIEIIYSSQLDPLSVITVIVVEEGIGCKSFKKIAAALQVLNEEDEGPLVFVTGTVQKSNKKPHICINKRSHVTLIALEPPKYPLVHDMDGNPISFPMILNEKINRQLKGSFSGAWFCPLPDSKLLRHHISAYRSSGGGVIYLGLQSASIESGQIKIENYGLCHQKLKQLKRQIEEACKAQRPHCCAQEWDSWTLPDNLKQRFDYCFNTYFTTSDRSTFVVRMVICPSEYPLHLCSEADLGLQMRHGETSSPYPINLFVSRMSETSADVERELEKITATSYTAPTVEIGPSLPLWQQLPPEGGNLDHKDCFEDPVEFAIQKLESYGATWLNDVTEKGGTLHLGVSNMPPLVTGLWFTKEATLELTAKLIERYKGSVEEKNFCFPPAINHFALHKRRITVCSHGLLSKSSKVLVLWLKVPKIDGHCSEPRDHVRRHLYCSWAHNHCSELCEILNLEHEHCPLVLPLNLGINGLLPPIEEAFPVAISKPRALDQGKIDKIVDALLLQLNKKKSSYLNCVASHQFIDCNSVADILDENYCIMDIKVSASKENILYLCKLPEFWKLDAPSDDNERVEHIGLCPKRMDFQEIALRCTDSSLAQNHLRAFFQFNDRPVLITDIGSHDINVMKGLALIPWTLVVDFNFGSSYSMRDIAEKESQHVFKISDLPLNKGCCFNSEDLSDAGRVYWVKALGPSNDLISDPNLWRLHLAPLLHKYIMQACSAIAPRVKILVVWSAMLNSSHFGQAIAEICLAAQQSNPYHMTEIAVVCPAITSPFLAKFKLCDLPRPPKLLSMSLDDLSNCVVQCCSAGYNAIDGWRKVPHEDFKLLPVETVRSMQAGGLDYLYPNIDNDLDIKNYDGGLAFFEGRTQSVRWKDFKAKVVVDRPETQSLYKRVKKSLRNRRDTVVINFTHHPGAGGSTVARDVLWRLKKTFCCIVPSQIYANFRQDVKQLIDTSEGRAVLVLWDTDLGIDFDTLISALKGLNAVILRVDRLVENAKTQVGLKEKLSFESLKQFFILFRSNAHFSQSREALDLLMVYAGRNKEEVPLFLVMVTALENRYVRLREYVKERLINITEDQKSILLQIAFARVYTGKSLQVGAVATEDKNWENSLPSSVSSMISFFHLHSRRVRMRHHCIDQLILSEITGIENTLQAWGLWLSDFVVKFIEHLLCVYTNISAWDSSGNNEFERILRGLFHEKQYNTQVSNFLSLIGSLAGKETAVTCMREVKVKLPNIERIIAHFLGDLARVHLHINDMDLKSALLVMKEAHDLLPGNRTLYHQEGQLYIDAMTLTQNTLLVAKEPTKQADEVIKLAQKASDCFMTSRNCKMQGRSSELYPWISDLQCHIKCLTDVCLLTKCSIQNLPRSLAAHEYIQNANDNMSFLLATLSTEDPVFYNKSLRKILELLGSEQDVDIELKKMFEVIEERSRDDVCHTNLQKKANVLQHINYLLRLRYEDARHVPESLCTTFTKAITSLIEHPRVINSALAQKGHKDRFFELELLWDWSRYANHAQHPISRMGMLSIIDKYLEKLSSPSLLRAKCLLYKGITLLLRLLCDSNPDVNPKDITAPISECNRILGDLLQHENRSWRYHEFLIRGYGKDLLSSKDWFWKDSLHRAVNDNVELNKGYDNSQHASFREFSGQIHKISSDGRLGEVTCAGLSFAFVPSNAPDVWRTVNSGEVKFYASVSAQKGLQAFPLCRLEADKRHRHTWTLGKQRQQGRIVEIDHDKGLVYFASPDPKQPYGTKANCKIDDLDFKPEIGDVYEFCVRKVRIEKETSFESCDLRFVEKAQDQVEKEGVF